MTDYNLTANQIYESKVMSLVKNQKINSSNESGVMFPLLCQKTGLNCKSKSYTVHLLNKC